MNHKKAFICTILLAIIAISIVITLLIFKNSESGIGLFYYFCPFIVGHWIGERLVDFYYWLRKI